MSDLRFKCHILDRFSSKAYQLILEFPNGFGMSVIHNNCGAYCTFGEDSFEFALMHDGHVVYTAEMPNVRVYQTSEEVMAFARELETWNPNKDYFLNVFPYPDEDDSDEYVDAVSMVDGLRRMVNS